jgi:hypothetical protein
MNRLQTVILYSLLILLFLCYISKSLLLGWIYFNIFISIYELYIIYNRKDLRESNCDDDFWDRDNNGEIWKKSWEEYACKTDKRYFNKNNYVFLLEFINVLLTIGLLYAISYKKNLIKTLLLLQFLNAVVYFTTLTAENHGGKGHIYRGISALWLIVPVLLLYRN